MKFNQHHKFVLNHLKNSGPATLLQMETSEKRNLTPATMWLKSKGYIALKDFKKREFEITNSGIEKINELGAKNNGL